MVEIDKIVIIVQKTWLDGLIEKFNTKEQARFYIEHMGGSFASYLLQHNSYYEALGQLKRSIPKSIRYQVVEKEFLPNFVFNPTDLIMVLGRDGLVINTAKYVNQPILAVNPNPEIVDGILLPFSIQSVSAAIDAITSDTYGISNISIAQADLNTNQSLIGVNDLFIGHRSHQSARYIISHQGQVERHSSSGIIVSTGIGSTGWYKSIITGAMGIAREFTPVELNIEEEDYREPWDIDYLNFCVREPWGSKTTGNSIVFGRIHWGEKLIIESNMPENGVIFSDGIESDSLEFNSGTIAEIGVSERLVQMYV